MSLKENSILATLIYSDIFDFPLTLNEIYLLLISNKKISKEAIKNSLNENKKIRKNGDYYFLRKRENIVSLRKKREKESALKINNNLALLRLIGLIPTIEFLGISGSVAVNNAKRNDDLDLFIITKKNTLWSSRFLVIFLLFIFGKKRSTNKKVSPNKICANMLIDESALLINKKNLFIAKEIAQIIPIVNKDETYENFLSKNKWIKIYLANFPIPKAKAGLIGSNFLFEYIDNIFFRIQKRYMASKITNEKIDKNYAWFHPNDISSKINEEFLHRTFFLSRYKLPKKNNITSKNPYATPLSYNVLLTPGY